MKKLVPSTLEVSTYTTDTVQNVGSCLFYLVHPNTKKLQEVTFYVAQNDGSVLISCTTTLVLGLIQPHTDYLDYLPSRASLNKSSIDHSKKTKRVSVHSSRKAVSAQSLKQESTVSNQQQLLPKLVTSKEQILQSYPDVFESIGHFPDHQYHIQLDPNITPEQTLCRPIPEHLKPAFEQENDKSFEAST